MKNLKPIPVSLFKRRQTLAAKAAQVSPIELPALPTVPISPAPVKPLQVQLENGEYLIPNAHVATSDPADAATCLKRTTRDIEVLVFCAKYQLTLSRNELWYLVINARPGECCGCSTLRGTPRITNGIMAWFERADGSIFDAHLHNFVPDKKERDSSTCQRMSRLAKLFASI